MLLFMPRNLIALLCELHLVGSWMFRYSHTYSCTLAWDSIKWIENISYFWIFFYDLLGGSRTVLHMGLIISHYSDKTFANILPNAPKCVTFFCWSEQLLFPALWVHCPLFSIPFWCLSLPAPTAGNIFIHMYFIYQYSTEHLKGTACGSSKFYVFSACLVLYLANFGHFGLPSLSGPSPELREFCGLSLGSPSLHHSPENFSSQ